MLKNKKGQVEEGILWIIRIIFIVTPLILAVAFFVGKFEVALDVSPVESVILEKRISNCISSETGVVNLAKFNTQTVEKCISFIGKGALSAKLVYSSETLEIRTADFNYLKPICIIKGENSVSCREYRKNVLVNDAGELIPGYIDMEILLQK